MTPTAKTAAKKPAAAANEVVVGRVARVIGPVVDIEFPADAIPDIYNALTVDIDLSSQGEDEGILHMTLEVAQHLGEAHRRPRPRRQGGGHRQADLGSRR